MDTTERNAATDVPSPPFPLSALDYDLPEPLIAQHPLPQRDASRLLVVDRSTEALADASIRDLPRWLARGDLLVLNDTRVVPARFTARRSSGGRVSGLFERELHAGEWLVLFEGSRRLRVGETLVVEGDVGRPVSIRMGERLDAGRWRITIDPPLPADAMLARIGRTPLPPYIKRSPDDAAVADARDRVRYQTVYARRGGAIAAPTAGLHLTESLLDQVSAAGVQTAFITLHIGIGTFTPIRTHRLSDHRMHAEWFELSRETAEAISACKARGGRVVAVGTSTVRALESSARRHAAGRWIAADHGFTDLFISPPYEFRVVDALLSNFHLPGSTLLSLVTALAGAELTRRAYRHAIESRYRFYSFGDAMLIV